MMELKLPTNIKITYSKINTLKFLIFALISSNDRKNKVTFNTSNKYFIFDGNPKSTRKPLNKIIISIKYIIYNLTFFLLNSMLTSY